MNEYLKADDSGPALLSGLSVLVIEDDYYLADDARFALEQAGAQVLGPFARAEEALQHLHLGPPDCAVLDINLGLGPEFETAEAMLARNVPMLFVTGYDHSAIPEAFSHVRCLQKPTSAKKLVEAVGELCRR